MFEALGKYLSIVLDYSIVLEYSNGVWFDELTYLFEDKGIDCYIDDTFKLLHRCVVQQQDPKDVHVQNAMRSLMQSLMSTNTLHVVHTCNTEYFIEQVKDLPECCILTTRKGIFTKRLYERAPEFNGDVAVLSNTGLKIFLGEEKVVTYDMLPRSTRGGGSEDFSYVSRLVPTAMASICAGSINDGYKYPLHHREVSFDTDALKYGSSLMAYIAFNF